MSAQWEITWEDSGREPQVPPHPAYPNGKDIDVAAAPGPWCRTPLPYPAARCGVFIVRCTRCDLVIGVTTAGRPDDPRSLTVSCKVRA